MPSSSPCRLLLFLRYPTIGHTKTRLIPALGAVGAAALQRHMAEYLVRRLQHPNWELQIHFSGASLAEMQAFLGPELVYCPQANGDLGDRLWHGFHQGFKEDYLLFPHRFDRTRFGLAHTQQASMAGRRLTSRTLTSRTLAIGADCPDLSCHHIQQAFDTLKSQDVVLGPASDGGYYLIGLRQPPNSIPDTPIKMLFQDIDWSTPRVFTQTLQKVQQLGLSCAQLETLSDVDRPEDLAIWERLQAVSQQSH
ncbi:MAG: TIGR04282 family arsenosugar biosynthesis glycosyltransferase [Cyanobacteria bacterium P01_D01_bin.105]